jgi:multiple sugar transport system substrate-binding protein
MKKLLLAGLAVTALGMASAQTVIKIQGFGGNDTAITSSLIKEVVNPALAADKITVEYQGIEGDYKAAILNGLSAGTAADIFYVDVFWAAPLFASGRVEPLNRYFQRPELAVFVPSLLNSFTLNNQVYGLPKDFNTLAVQFNKDLFDEAKVPYPTATDTWDTFKDKLRRVQSALKDVAGLCVVADHARFGAFAHAAGWRPYNAEGKVVLDANFKRAFTWYTSLVKDGAGKYAQDLGEGWTGGCIGGEKAAVSIEGAWVGGFLKDKAPNMNFGTTLLPLDPVSKGRGNFIFTVSWSMNAASKNKAAAAKVMRALTSPAAQNWILSRGLALPSRTALGNSPLLARPGKDGELNRVVFQGSTRSGGAVLPFSFGTVDGGDYMRPINEALLAVLTGKKSVDQAITDAQAEMNRIIK